MVNIKKISNAGAIFKNVFGLKELHFTIKGEDKTLCNIDLTKVENKIVTVDLDNITDDDTLYEECKNVSKEHKIALTCGACMFEYMEALKGINKQVG